MTSETAKGLSSRRTFLPVLLSYAASGGSLIVGSAAQLLTFAILARFLGVHEFSLFVAITAISNIAVHLCGLGAMECLVRRVARDRAMYPVMLGHNLILTAVSGAVLVALGVALLPLFFTLSADPVTNVAVITLMLVTNILLVRLIVLAEQIQIAHSDFARANLVVVGFALARTLAAALACIGFGVATVADWAVWQLACHVVVALACWRFLAWRGRPVWRLVRDELPLGLYFSVPFILRAVRQNVDLLVLSLVATAEIVASYSVARRMLESSYLAVEAMNRIVYPTSARATAAGMQDALPRIRRLALAATGISLAAAVAVFVLAPVLPWLFGRDYVSLVGFARILCWLVVPLAMWAVALEALGAAGHQAQRALVMGLGSLIGAAIAAAATWYAPPTGTFVSFYVIEFAMVIAAWTVLLKVVERDRAQAAGGIAPAADRHDR